MVNNTRAFLYCRVARDDDFSLEAQKRELCRYAEQAGYTIISIYAESGSGLTLERPALQMATKDILFGEAELLLVKSIDRIGRDWGLTQRYIDYLTGYGVKLICVKDRCLFSEKGICYF